MLSSAIGHVGTATGLLGMTEQLPEWMLTLFSAGTAPLQWSVVVIVSVISACTDLKSRRIPNAVTFPALIAGLAVAVWTGGVPGAADALAAACLISFPYLLLFIFAGGGAGDVKLMAAIGAWLGLVNGILVLLAVALCGIGLGIAVAVARRRVAAVFSSILSIGIRMVVVGPQPGPDGEVEAGENALTVPYGVAICAGVIISAIGVLVWAP